jgi:hypothetical protein
MVQCVEHMTVEHVWIEHYVAKPNLILQCTGACDTWAQISGRQTPGLTRGSAPLLYNKCVGGTPG